MPVRVTEEELFEASANDGSSHPLPMRRRHLFMGFGGGERIFRFSCQFDAIFAEKDQMMSEERAPGKERHGHAAKRDFGVENPE